MNANRNATAFVRRNLFEIYSNMPNTLPFKSLKPPIKLIIPMFSSLIWIESSWESEIPFNFRSDEIFWRQHLNGHFLAIEIWRPKSTFWTGRQIKKLCTPLERSRKVDLIFAKKHWNRPSIGQDMANQHFGPQFSSGHILANWQPILVFGTINDMYSRRCEGLHWFQQS